MPPRHGRRPIQPVRTPPALAHALPLILRAPPPRRSVAESRSFQASSRTKCIFRALQYRFVLAEPVARFHPAGGRTRTRPAGVRVCLRIDAFALYQAGNDSLKADYLPFRKALPSGAPPDSNALRQARERVNWCQRLETQAMAAAEIKRKNPDTAPVPQEQPQPQQVTYLEEVSRGEWTGALSPFRY